MHKFVFKILNEFRNKNSIPSMVIDNEYMIDFEGIGKGDFRVILPNVI